MKAPSPEPLAIHGLPTEEERRPLSVAGHHAWREGIAAPDRHYDEIDELVEEIRAREFEEKGARP